MARFIICDPCFLAKGINPKLVKDLDKNELKKALVPNINKEYEILCLEYADFDEGEIVPVNTPAEKLLDEHIMPVIFQIDSGLYCIIRVNGDDDTIDNTLTPNIFAQLTVPAVSDYFTHNSDNDSFCICGYRFIIEFEL